MDRRIHISTTVLIHRIITQFNNLTYVLYKCNIVGMKYLTKFLILVVAFLCVDTHNVSAYTNRQVAVLRALNKAAGKAQNVRVPVDTDVKLDKLGIYVRACKQTDPFDAENYFAFVEITDSAQGQVFGGWMDRNNPGKRPVEHPDWDIWLVGCEDQ